MKLYLQNPLTTDLHLDVIIEGMELYGEPMVIVPPSASSVYKLQFSPTVIGKTKAR